MCYHLRPAHIHTMDTYGHYLKLADKEAAERLDKLYSEKFQHMTK